MHLGFGTLFFCIDMRNSSDRVLDENRNLVSSVDELKQRVTMLEQGGYAPQAGRRRGPQRGHPVTHTPSTRRPVSQQSEDDSDDFVDPVPCAVETLNGTSETTTETEFPEDADDSASIADGHSRGPVVIDDGTLTRGERKATRVQHLANVLAPNPLVAGPHKSGGLVPQGLRPRGQLPPPEVVEQFKTIHNDIQKGFRKAFRSFHLTIEARNRLERGAEGDNIPEDILKTLKGPVCQFSERIRLEAEAAVHESQQEFDKMLSETRKKGHGLAHLRDQTDANALEARDQPAYEWQKCGEHFAVGRLEQKEREEPEECGGLQAANRISGRWFSIPVYQTGQNFKYWWCIMQVADYLGGGQLPSGRL
ncbi:hypothetical protein B0H14DRAFT_3718541 [Mycena olivaceomarginata]|nr:hypothetical protein B0H14DRAFT_3718541 [Mycena olivaceomarginata]